jgi:predicted RNase H-like HicB family nuclease
VGAGRELALAPALAAVNGEGREYAVLVASEEDNVNEYKSFFSIVLDHPQFLGQGETKESALRQASRLLHYALGSMVLKNETIPAPSAGAELEVRRPLQCIGSEFRVDCCRRIGEM